MALLPAIVAPPGSSSLPLAQAAPFEPRSVSCLAGPKTDPVPAGQMTFQTSCTAITTDGINYPLTSLASIRITYWYDRKVSGPNDYVRFTFTGSGFNGGHLHAEITQSLGVPAVGASPGGHHLR